MSVTRERERERERETQRHRETERDGEREKERHRGTERLRETWRERGDVQLHITMFMEVKKKPFSRSVRSHSLTKESD